MNDITKMIIGVICGNIITIAILAIINSLQSDHDT